MFYVLEFSKLNKQFLINIAASIYTNIGEADDMNLICLSETDASEIQVNKNSITKIHVNYNNTLSSIGFTFDQISES